MKHRSRSLALVALLLATAVPASANIAPPDLPKKKKNAPVSMHIQPDGTAKEAKLLIPRSVFQQLRAELEGEDSQTAAAAANTFTPTGTQTAVAGLFLSLSLVLGGMWLVNSRAAGRRASRVASAVAFLALGGVAGGVAVYANAGPPPVARSLTSKILISELSYWGAYGTVKVEVAGKDEDQIVLVLPKTAKESSGE